MGGGGSERTAKQNVGMMPISLGAATQLRATNVMPLQTCMMMWMEMTAGRAMQGQSMRKLGRF